MRQLFLSRAFVLVLVLRVIWTIAAQTLLLSLAWQAYEITGEAWTLALIGLFQFIPVLLGAIPAGYLVDHHDRRHLVALSLVLQLLCAGGLAIWAAGEADGVTVLFIASVLLGLARSVLLPALQAIVPSLVSPLLLPRAMASVATASQISVIAGPALAGFLLIAGVQLAYSVSAMLLAAAAGLALALRLPARSEARQPLSRETLFAGFHFIGRRPVILGAILLDLLAVLFGGAVALLPLYVKDILEAGPATLGLLRAAPAAGALLTSLWLLHHPITRAVGPKLLRATAVFGLSTIVFGLSRDPWLSAAALVVYGAADMVSVVIRQTLVQLETPDAMRGRVSAVNSVFIGASNQLGEFQMGAAAALLGPVLAVVLGGVVTATLPLVWKQRFPELSRRDALLRPPDSVPYLHTTSTETSHVHLSIAQALASTDRPLAGDGVLDPESRLDR